MSEICGNHIRTKLTCLISRTVVVNVVGCWCLEQGADLHMAQLMPLPFTVCCFSKILIGFFLFGTGSPG